MDRHESPLTRRFVVYYCSALYSKEPAVQRCRNHKLENVMNELPKEEKEQTRKLMRAAFKAPTAEEGKSDWSKSRGNGNMIAPQPRAACGKG